MLGRTSIDAYRSFVEPIQDAFNTIAKGRIHLPSGSASVASGARLDLLMNNGIPLPLRSSVLGSISLQIAMRASIELVEFGPYHFQCITCGYWYSFVAENGQEVVAFHWTPNAQRNERSFPHMHIGRAISARSALSEDRVHKLHIPTGVLSSHHIVRFAIQELGVQIQSSKSQAAVIADLNRQIGDA